MTLLPAPQGLAILAVASSWWCAASHRAGAVPAAMLETDAFDMDPTMLAELDAVAGEGALGPYWVDQVRVKNSGYSAAYCGYSKDNCTTLDDFPGSNVHSELTWAPVVRELQEVPRLQKAGQIYRAGELGYAVANAKFWARDVGRLSLGMSVPDHEFVRPILDRILGVEGEGKTWTEESLRERAKEFFAKHGALETLKDLHMFVTKILHKVHLDMDLSDEEAEDFTSFQQELKVKIVLPAALTKLSNWKKLQDTRDRWLARYDEAVRADGRNVFPTSMSAEQRKVLLSTLLDSLIFAGGLSVPGFLMIGIAVVKDQDSPWTDMKSDISSQGDLAQRFAYEVLRRYPLVVGFPWYTPDQKHRTVMNLAMALRDPRVWGGDALDFRLRDLETYRRLARVAWAEPANGPEAWAVPNPGRSGHLTPMSRGCPGQALSMTILSTFFEEFLKVQSSYGVYDAPKGGISITDCTPFVPDITLAKVVMSGHVFVDGSMLGGKAGYKFQARLGVLFAGDGAHPAKLLLFEHGDYRKDDPSKAQTISLAQTEGVRKKPAAKYGFKPEVECLKINGRSPVRLCVDGEGHASASAAREAWLQAFFASYVPIVEG